MKKTKIIVVGFGFMGQTHAGNLLKNSHAELAGIVDPCDPAERLTTIKGNKATVTITIEQAKKVPHYKTLDEALVKAEPDAVIIALPTKLHYSAVMQCLHAGKHVMVEKPFAVSERECAEMVRTAREKQKLLMVGYVVRCMREYEILKETCQSGRLGKLKFAKFTRFTGVPSWGNWNDPEFIKASGGALFDLVSHDIDFTRFCFGEPEKITANPSLSGDLFTTISASFKYKDFYSAVEGAFVTPSAFPFHRSYTAFFEKGTLLSEEPGQLATITSEGVQKEDFSKIDPYYVETDRFLRALETGDASMICCSEDAAKSIACCSDIARQIGYPLPE